MSTMLTPDAQVPALSIDTLDGSNWTLADQSPRNFTQVVFYRGHHCPLCKMYLQKLDGLIAGYQEAGVETIAVSMNSKDLAQASKDDWELQNVVIGYGLSEGDARRWGLYISKAFKEVEADIFAEPGLFWVRPDGRLYLLDISNMPWARPDMEFMLGKVQFAVDNGYPARGTG